MIGFRNFICKKIFDSTTSCFVDNLRFIPHNDTYNEINSNHAFRSCFIFRGYVFTAPKKLYAGEIESGCLSLHNLELPAHVHLELVFPFLEEQEVLASTSAVIKTGKFRLIYNENCKLCETKKKFHLDLVDRIVEKHTLLGKKSLFFD